MDLTLVQKQLDKGAKLKVKYRYPCDDTSSIRYAVRSDRLVDISLELGRLYTRFRGETPIWITEGEVLEVVPDDGVYEDFPNG